MLIVNLKSENQDLKLQLRQLTSEFTDFREEFNLLRQTQRSSNELMAKETEQLKSEIQSLKRLVQDQCAAPSTTQQDVQSLVATNEFTPTTVGQQSDSEPSSFASESQDDSWSAEQNDQTEPTCDVNCYERGAVMFMYFKMVRNYEGEDLLPWEYSIVPGVFPMFLQIIFVWLLFIITGQAEDEEDALENIITNTTNFESDYFDEYFNRTGELSAGETDDSEEDVRGVPLFTIVSLIVFYIDMATWFFGEFQAAWYACFRMKFDQAANRIRMKVCAWLLLLVDFCVGLLTVIGGSKLLLNGSYEDVLLNVLALNFIVAIDNIFLKLADQSQRAITNEIQNISFRAQIEVPKYMLIEHSKTGKISVRKTFLFLISFQIPIFYSLIGYWLIGSLKSSKSSKDDWDYSHYYYEYGITMITMMTGITMPLFFALPLLNELMLADAKHLKIIMGKVFKMESNQLLKSSLWSQLNEQPLAKDYDGWRLLHHIAMRNRIDLAMDLFSKMDRLDAEELKPNSWNEPYSFGINELSKSEYVVSPVEERCSPFHIAAKHGSEDIVDAFLARADIAIFKINFEGKTAWEVAEEHNHIAIAAKIQAHAATFLQGDIRVRFEKS